MRFFLHNLLKNTFRTLRRMCKKCSTIEIYEITDNKDEKLKGVFFTSCYLLQMYLLNEFLHPEEASEVEELPGG